MDGNLIASLTGTAPANGGKKKAGAKADGDAFSAALDDATRTKGEANKANEAMIDDSQKGEKSEQAKEKEAKQRAAQRELEHQLKGSQHTPAGAHDLRNSAAVRKLMQNVDSMTLAEKQSLRVGEFSQESLHKAEVAQNLGLGNNPAAVSNTTGTKQQQGVHEARGAAAQANEEVIARDPKDREKAAQANQAKGEQPSLEKMITKEANFAEELQKSSQLSKNHERQVVLEQLLQHIEVRNLANKTELYLKLNPEYLGELKVKLMHTDEGIKADFETSSRATRDVLTENEDELRAQAAKKGVRLGQMQVKLVDQV